MAGKLQFKMVILSGCLACATMASDSPAKDTNLVAIDRVVMATGSADRDFLNDYHKALVKSALEHSAAEFGPYEIEFYNAEVNNARILREMETISGQHKINVHITTASSLRQLRLITIHIPVRMGLLSYRLLVVHKRNLDKFSNIRNMEALREFRAGSGARWITTDVLQRHNFSIVTFPRYEPMYSMLKRNRFDFLLRGVSEIYPELEACGIECDELAIVPGIQVYLPVPYYIFISKHQPRIAERIEKGLLLANQDGSFNALFMHYHRDAIQRAKVAERHIISIPNHDLAGDPALKQKDFWITPCDMAEENTPSACADFSDIMQSPLPAIN